MSDGKIIEIETEIPYISWDFRWRTFLVSKEDCLKAIERTQEMNKGLKKVLALIRERLEEIEKADS